jgi:DNA-binding NarL/FixJ family response regulator
MSSPARVLVADADTPTRMGVRLALLRAGFEIAAECVNGRDAVEAALREQPDVVLLAADLPGGGIGAARTIGARLPATKIIVLTASQTGEELVVAVLAGATGYIGKDMSPARLPRVVQGVLAGEAALPRRYTTQVLEVLRGRDARRARILGKTRHFVTERQWEILQLLADGRSTAEMARALGISEVTARRHISSVLPKLGLKDRESAMELMRGRSAE